LNIVHRLKNVPIFQRLTDDQLKRIESLVTPRCYPRGAIIVHEGEIGDSMEIIIKGSVKVVYFTGEGQEVILSTLEPGQFFGEMSLLDNEPRSATVMAQEKTETLHLQREPFLNMMRNNPDMMMDLIQELVRRIRLTSRVLERLCTMDVAHRLMDFLIELSERHGAAFDETRVRLTLPTHQTIANQLGTSRESISRTISQLRRDGLIEASEGRDVLIDIEKLREGMDLL